MRTGSLVPLSALFLASTSYAFRDSSPLLIWSSTPNAALHDASEAITSGVISAEEVYGTMSSLGCEWDALVVAHVDELHQSHLESLSLPSASADLHIPYLIRPTRAMLHGAVDEWAALCGAEVTSTLGDLGEGKTIVKLDIAKDDDALTTLSSRLPESHLILLTGSRTSSKTSKSQSHTELKRQERPFPSHTSTSRPISSSTASPGGSSNTTLPTDALVLDRYQLLTTPIITALLLSFGLFIPIIVFGVSALAGIQVPPRMMEIGKGMIVGKEKKDQ